jgi:hypothetical protein
LAGETEVLGENLPQSRFVHHKPHMLPVREPGPPRWENQRLTAELRHGLLKSLTKVLSRYVKRRYGDRARVTDVTCVRDTSRPYMGRITVTGMQTIQEMDTSATGCRNKDQGSVSPGANNGN